MNRAYCDKGLWQPLRNPDRKSLEVEQNSTVLECTDGSYIS